MRGVGGGKGVECRFDGRVWCFVRGCIGFFCGCVLEVLRDFTDLC